MARARNVKPGLFKNEVLVELPFEFRYMFVGLWTLADREGRLEDRPVRIKMELFPADNVDVNAGLDALDEHGFIKRYEADGSKYIQILAWNKHQNPHCKEAPSTIPAWCEHSSSPEKAVTSRADSLIPDSLNPQPGAPHRKRGAAKRGSRLPSDWSLTPEYREAAAQINPRVNAETEAAKFRDYWCAKSGKDATKVDWIATWRNWIRRASEDARPRAGPHGKPPIAQQFAQKTYEGTPDDQLPAFLRN